MEESERLCWFCKHITYFDAQRGWSEYIPAAAWELYCNKNKFEELNGYCYIS
jgi:hypothetical protein